MCRNSKDEEIDFWPKDWERNFANKQSDIADYLCNVWENSRKSLLNDKTVARSPGSENSP